MSMQIKSITIYSKNGEPRTIDFELGKVNIITGKSNTGKSTLIDIVEYCLGQSDFKIPYGVIRESVSWYSVLYQINDTQIFIAKQPPEDYGASQSNIYFKVGANINVPPFGELEHNSNDSTLVQYLTNMIGISPNLNIPPEGQSRKPLEANLKHTYFYLFQKQGTIADQETLFHRQKEPFMPQAIKDTLPYFLGAVPENRLKLIQELREAKRNLSILEKKLAEAEAITNSELNTGRSLIREAQQVGIIPNNIDFKTPEDMISILKKAMDWKPQEPKEVGEDLLPQLKEQLAEIEDSIRYKNDQISAAESFANEAAGFSTEAREQEIRLDSINLFPNDIEEGEICPLCSSHLKVPIAGASMLNKALSDLRNSLVNVSKERPRLLEYIQNLKNERNEMKLKAKQIEQDIIAINKEYEQAKKVSDLNTRIGIIIGRISLYIESLELVDTLSPLQKQVDTARKKVEEYEKQLNSQEIEERLTSSLNYIGSLMTTWANRLELEHKGFPFRFDLNKLNVVIDRKGIPILMSKNLGGGSNWLGCHMITLLALHKYFLENNRPVPNFLMLDQPTQVYFVPEKYERMEGIKGEVTDEDSLAVSRLFNFLFEVCNELYPNFQIIVTEHANLDNPDFQKCVIEDPWRGDRALVPYAWINVD